MLHGMQKAVRTFSTWHTSNWRQQCRFQNCGVVGDGLWEKKCFHVAKFISETAVSVSRTGEGLHWLLMNRVLNETNPEQTLWMTNNAPINKLPLILLYVWFIWNFTLWRFRFERENLQAKTKQTHSSSAFVSTFFTDYLKGVHLSIVDKFQPSQAEKDMRLVITPLSWSWGKAEFNRLCCLTVFPKWLNITWMVISVGRPGAIYQWF